MIETNLQTTGAVRPVPPVGRTLDARLLADARTTVWEATTPSLVPLIADYRRAVEAMPRFASYKAFDDAALAVQGDILRRFGGNGFAIAHAALMIEAIQAFRENVAASGHPRAIVDEFDRTFARIVAKIADAEWTGYDAPADRLWKDFATARGRLVPAAAWGLDVGAAYGRGFLLRGGPRQFLGALRFARGNRHWVTGHLNEYEKHRFNEAGFRSMARLVAGLLETRPDLNGLFLGPSWLYSPQLAEISPRLDFHRRLALPAGARAFFSHPGGADSLALVASETRRRAFAEGRYRPDNYILIWRRDDLLAWVRSQPS